MSLLMKALEKAAKDRDEARAEPAAATATAPAAAAGAAPSKTELALEPIAGEAPAAPRTEVAARPAPTRVPAAVTAREQAQAQASTVLQASAAGHAARVRVVTYVREHPLPVLAALAALFALIFGIYAYLQIAHPGLFIGRPPPAPRTVLPPLVEAPTAPTPAPVAPPAPPQPLPAAPLLKEAAAASVAAVRRKPAPVAIEEPAPRSAVVVSAGSAESVLNPLLARAYAALQAGQLDQARRDYAEVLSTEPRSVDALLGLAAIAVRIGDSEEATRRYLQILELEPRHPLAQAGLIGLLGRADPAAAESKLKQLISLDPSAYLYFTLGNLYADQSKWAAAQQAYFQAHHLDSTNPDYAYNLAVGLEHVSQPKLALGFYRRALQLAAAKGRANFSVPQAQERIGTLASQVE